MIVGSNLIAFLFSLGIILFFINLVLVKMNKKELAIIIDIIGFAIATIAGLNEFDSAYDAIKQFADSARL